MDWLDLPPEIELNIADLLDRMGIPVTEGTLAGMTKFLQEYGVSDPGPYMARFPNLY